MTTFTSRMDDYYLDDLPSVDKHINILGWLHITYSILLLFSAGLVFFFVCGVGVLSGDPTAITVTPVIGLVASSFLCLLALPGLICGYGLLNRESWSRVLALVLGILNIFNLPFGTAIGAYSLWTLLDEDAQLCFESV